MLKVARGHVCACAKLTVLAIAAALAAFGQTDPGVRAGAPATTAISAANSGAGGPMPGLTPNELKFFKAGKDAFEEEQTVSGAGGTESGLGPRFNHNSCAGCHAHPATGGSSPAKNPQVTVAPPSQVNQLLALNIISPDGPVREVRFKSDGGVHDLFTIMGLPDTPRGCNIAQPDFRSHVAANDVIFRIPTPVFGGGLIEAISDATILANQAGSKPFGIGGRANRNGNDGTITRFGHKAQNKSLLIFAAEAYNVEQGITTDMFSDDRGEGGLPDPTPCSTVPSGDDGPDFDATDPVKVLSDASHFANFMRFLAPAPPVFSGYATSSTKVDSASIGRGATLFVMIGCAVCHTPSLPTGNHSSQALSNQKANLYSDLLVHNMGRLGDGVSQGLAGPDEFRTAPLWGLGQRIFFLHDGRTNDLLEAIQAHAAGGNDSRSEASQVIQRFNQRSKSDRQDVLNFLRAL